MPITSSAKKALRQNRKIRVINEKRKKNLKDTIKKFKKDLKSEGLSLVYQALDKAAKMNLIKKNKASRLKSRLSHLIAKSVKAVS
mgnify:CR=1 FL=1